MLTAMRAFITGTPAVLAKQTTPTAAHKPGKSPVPMPTSASTTPAPRPGTAMQEQVQWGKLGTTIYDTHARTGDVLSLLHDLAAPPPDEELSQVQGLVDAMAEALTVLKAMQETQRIHGEVLSRLLRQHPGSGRP